MIVPLPSYSLARPQSLLLPLLWVVMGSALIFESDAYRYATILLVALSIWQFKDLHRLLMRDWLAWLCWAWGGYVLVRFAIGIVVHDEKGTSEWLYAFPLLFPALGVALYAMREHLFAAVTALIAAAAAGLLLTNDVMTLMSGGRTYPLFHNNPIHAAVACGMLMVISIFWTLYVIESGRLKQRGGRLLLYIGLATALLCLVGIFGARSKGVWLALVPTAFFMICAALFCLRGRLRLAAVGLLVLVSMAAAYAGADRVTQVAGPTFDATKNLTNQITREEGLPQALRSAIEEPRTPTSMRERLELWVNALHIFQSSPFIGSGNVWLEKWRAAPYPEVRYNILHNGYLEILVRHGLAGILVLVIFVRASFLQLRQSSASGEIFRSVALGLLSVSFFFFMTITTNSNNRLAIGESFFLVAGAAVLALRISRRGVARKAPKTVVR